MGDSGLSQEQASMNYDLCAFYTMWALNIQDSQVRGASTWATTFRDKRARLFRLHFRL